MTKSFATRKAADTWATQVAHDKLKGVAIDPRSGTELFANYAEKASELDSYLVSEGGLGTRLHGPSVRSIFGSVRRELETSCRPRRGSLTGAGLPCYVGQKGPTTHLRLPRDNSSGDVPDRACLRVTSRVGPLRRSR